MLTEVIEIGDELGIILPPSYIEKFDIKVGDVMYFDEKDDCFMLIPRLTKNTIENYLDHQKALNEIELFMNAKSQTPQGERLDFLVSLVEEYEKDIIL